MEVNIHPFRQVHMDFHTSGLIPDVAGKFDLEEFAETLYKANVNSVTLFAKCHHGYIYYDSKRFANKIHPNLKDKDLLKKQIAACKKRGIRTPIYITVEWDNLTAHEHPEWLVLDGKGNFLNSEHSIYEPGFYYNLCINSPYRELVKEHIRDVFENFQDVDGIFLDIVNAFDCSCMSCACIKLQDQ